MPRLPAGRRGKYPQSRYRINPANIAKAKKAGFDLSNFFDSCLTRLLENIDAVTGAWAADTRDVTILETDKAAIRVRQVPKHGPVSDSAET